MVRRRPYRSIWKEFDEMIADIEAHFGEMVSSLEAQGYLPVPGFQQRMIPAIRGEFSIDVREHEDEVIVVADLPGVEKQDISIYLIEPLTLEVSTVREKAREGEGEGYYVQERISGTMKRRVELPSEVTEEGTTATFNNGILELHLRKKTPPRGKKIEVE